MIYLITVIVILIIFTKALCSLSKDDGKSNIDESNTIEDIDTNSQNTQFQVTFHNADEVNQLKDQPENRQ